MRLLKSLPLLALVLLASCGDVTDDLVSADRITLYSLDPYANRPIKWRAEEPTEAFHGYSVVGKVELDAPARQRAVAALRRGLNRGHAAACFDPRHGLRAVSNGRTTDYVICFECGQCSIYRDRAMDGSTLVSDEPEPVLDAVLKEAGVALAPKSWDDAEREAERLSEASGATE